MFPAQTTIRLLELRVNKLTIALGEERIFVQGQKILIMAQEELIEAQRNKIMALEAIIQEDTNGHGD